MQVTWRKSNGIGDSWEFHSVGDVFENGASFMETQGGQVPKPNYNPEQSFKVVELIKVIIWSWFKVEVLNLNYPFSGKHINPRDCLNSQLPVVV